MGVRRVVNKCYIEMLSASISKPIIIECDYDHVIKHQYFDKACFTFHNANLSAKFINDLMGAIEDHKPTKALLTLQVPHRKTFDPDRPHIYTDIHFHQNHQAFREFTQFFQLHDIIGRDSQRVLISAVDRLQIHRLKAPYQTDCHDYGSMTDWLFTFRLDCDHFCPELLFYDRHCTRLNCSKGLDLTSLSRRNYARQYVIEKFVEGDALVNKLYLAIKSECSILCSKLDCLENRVRFNLVSKKQFGPELRAINGTTMHQVDLLTDHLTIMKHEANLEIIEYLNLCANIIGLWFGLSLKYSFLKVLLLLFALIQRISWCRGKNQISPA